MIPQAMRFYGQSLDETLSMRAVSFFSLVNMMYRLQADESMVQVANVNAGFSGGKEYMSDLQKQSKGIHGIVQEVRTVKP